MKTNQIINNISTKIYLDFLDNSYTDIKNTTILKKSQNTYKLINH